MMTEQEFISLYKEEIPIFSSWGDFVNLNILDSLKNYFKFEDELNNFLKIPPVPRVKEVKSLVSKAFYRADKNYTDPYNQITDKVGVRYVVLLQEDINIISKIVEKNNSWKFSKDRDFEEEKFNKPFVFDYQSIHYVVFSKREFEYKNILIPQNTPCEIQIRTLLQHAYSELTHDTIYKPIDPVPPNVLRIVAKSMALIETTNDLFSDVQKTLKNESKNNMFYLKKLEEIYSEITNPDLEKKLNMFILNSFKDLLSEINMEDIEHFFQNSPHLKEIILRKYNDYLIYRQPIVLLIFYLISKNYRNKLRKFWPLTDNELRPMFIDMGYNLD